MPYNAMRALQRARSLVVIFALGACGGGGGPALQALPQTVSFATAPTLLLGSTAQVGASASSGLPVSYATQSPTVCSVVAATGVVSALALGNCVIEALQLGDAHYAPARASLTLPVVTPRVQTITVGIAPTLTLYGTATVTASASSGLEVHFDSMTPAVCTVHPSSGLVTDLSAGDCIIAISQAGDVNFDPAPTVTLTLVVAAGGNGGTPPAAPEGVSATLGSDDQTVIVNVTGVPTSGGSPITSYSVQSTPPGLAASATSLPISVSCPAGCSGYAFAVQAHNAYGAGAASALAHVMSAFALTARFFEPDTQPNDSIFTGTFILDSTTRTVSALEGNLTESMTGSASVPMTVVPLKFQLAVVAGVDGALRVSTFARDSSDVFAPSGFADTDNGIYYGYPAAYSTTTANAFVTVYIHPQTPRAPLGKAQIDTLIYGDCAPGGMMGAVCMTGVVGGGTMGGYPVAQTITLQATVPTSVAVRQQR